MKLFNVVGALAALAVSFAAAAPAHAVDYLLNLTDSQAGPGPYGQVSVIEAGGGLQFTVTLFNGLKFTDTGSHFAFSFSLTGAPAITLTPLAGFTLVTNSDGIANSPFGAFDYGLACSICDPNTGGLAGPLVFTVTGAGATLANIASATNTFNGQLVLFAADAISPTGVTGTVGGGGPVPEPATWAMMILGFGMIGVGLRMRRREDLLVT
jgi:hypothetical protein